MSKDAPVSYSADVGVNPLLLIIPKWYNLSKWDSAVSTDGCFVLETFVEKLYSPGFERSDFGDNGPRKSLNFVS